jgi:pseudouridine kinase
MHTPETDTPRVAVVGSVFLDLIYDRPLDDHTAKPIQQFHGGIGRNISENLGWIGQRPRLVTLITPDSLGECIAAELADAGTELAAKYVSPGIGTYKAFVQAGETKEYHIEQPLIEQLDWHFVSKHLGSVTHVVVETGLDRSMIDELLTYCKKYRIRVCGIPTRLRDLPLDWHLAIIGRLDCVIMNRAEAETLLGCRITNHKTAVQSVAELQRKGAHQAVITLDADGAAAANHYTPPAVYTITGADVVNTLGCGDAFTAGLLAASMSGHSFPAAINAAFELAKRTAETPGPVHAGAGRALLAALHSTHGISSPRGLRPLY